MIDLDLAARDSLYRDDVSEVMVEELRLARRAIELAEPFVRASVSKHPAIRALDSYARCAGLTAAAPPPEFASTSTSTPAPIACAHEDTENLVEHDGCMWIWCLDCGAWCSEWAYASKPNEVREPWTLPRRAAPTKKKSDA